MSKEYRVEVVETIMLRREYIVVADSVMEASAMATVGSTEHEKTIEDLGVVDRFVTGIESPAE